MSLFIGFGTKEVVAPLTNGIFRDLGTGARLLWFVMNWGKRV